MDMSVTARLLVLSLATIGCEPTMTQRSDGQSASPAGEDGDASSDLRLTGEEVTIVIDGFVLHYGSVNCLTAWLLATISGYGS
jgi:hypothetical protein